MLIWKDRCGDTDRQISRFFTVCTKCQTKFLVSIPALLCLLKHKGNTFRARQMSFKELFDYITSIWKEDATMCTTKKKVQIRI